MATTPIATTNLVILARDGSATTEEALVLAMSAKAVVVMVVARVMAVHSVSVDAPWAWVGLHGRTATNVPSLRVFSVWLVDALVTWPSSVISWPRQFALSAI